ncbi:type IV secretion system DNA-binding domain-containing protein [Bacillus mycoides]|uniref:type IV secretion system DNA-binding domain-containing protein n=1 Tax=Bacillus mycoides TaxID=1405 RepID=UPI003CFFAA2C
MKETFIGRSEKSSNFIKPECYDMGKPNVLVTGKSGEGIGQRYVFAEENRNILVRGSVGKGKTWLLKQTINIIIIEDVQLTILDGCGEYQEYEEQVCVIPFAHEGVFLTLSEQQQCKQSQVVVIDETMKWYRQDPEQFLTFLEDLEQLNIGIIANFQEEPPPELAAKFGETYNLDEEKS